MHLDEIGFVFRTLLLLVEYKKNFNFVIQFLWIVLLQSIHISLSLAHLNLKIATFEIWE